MKYRAPVPLMLGRGFQTCNQAPNGVIQEQRLSHHQAGERDLGPRGLLKPQSKVEQVRLTHSINVYPDPRDFRQKDRSVVTQLILGA